MPAAAVTPALIVYIKVVAVKKLVVGFQRSASGRAFLAWLFGPFFSSCAWEGGWRRTLGSRSVFFSTFFFGYG